MIQEFFKRSLPVLIFFILGSALAALLVPTELEQMKWEVAGMPPSYPMEQKMRPILLMLLCYIPFIGAICYAFMGTMSRYIARNFINYFLLCTGILMMIYILADFTDNMERFNTRFEEPVKQCLIFYCTQLPMFLYQILPYTLMMGTLWSLSKLCGSSELTGMLQSGRSLLRLCIPIFIFGSLVALVYGIFGFHWAPNGALYREIHLKQYETAKGGNPIIYRHEASSRIWRIEHPATLADPGQPMRELVLEQFDQEKPGRLLYQLRAAEARWNKEAATWTFNKVYKREVISFEDNIAFEDLNSSADAYQESLTMAFDEKPYQIICPATRGGNDTIGTSTLYEYIASGAGSKLDRAQKRTEWHTRIARIFTCIVLILLAIPNAITFQRRTAMKGIGLALLMAALLLFFYRVFPTLGESGIIPAWISAWITNILYLLVTIWLINRNLAHRNLKECIIAMFRKKA
ncbi:MAG: LptF/LptG family permease [Akkermansia sp.]